MRSRQRAPVHFLNINSFVPSVFLEKIEDCLEDPELLGPTFKEHVSILHVSTPLQHLQ